MSEPVEAATPEQTEPPIEQKLVHKGFIYVSEDGDVLKGAEAEAAGAAEEADGFFAFCRLPNGFQRREIRNKGLAAKARTSRRADDPDSDLFAVLEADVEALRRRGDTEPLVEQLMSQDAFQDLSAAIDDVKDEHADEFVLIDDDIRRLQEVEDGDERAELEKHTQRYWDLVNETLKRRQDPRRHELEQLDIDELVRRVREMRVEALSTDEFMQTYGEWQMYLCTYKRDRKTRAFGSIEELREADDEVLTAVRAFFDELERGIPKG